MSITQDMLSKLHTLDEAKETLSTTEPVTSVEFEAESGNKFDLPAGFTSNNSTVKLGNTTYEVSPDALLSMAAFCGLPKSYVLRTPADLIEPQLNYWFQRGLDDKSFKALAVGGDTIQAVTRGTITPFSNLQLLEKAEESLKHNFGSDVEILVDEKFSHSLTGTWLRLVVPSEQKDIQGSPVNGDTWSLGLQIKNSQTGQGGTAIDGYLFRWWCSNGAIVTDASAGVWSRRSSGQSEEDVYEWARGAVDEILGGLSGAFDQVQHMVHVSLDGEVQDSLRDIFDRYRVPMRLRNPVIDEMVESDDLTMYGVMNAVTAAANAAGLPESHVEQLMRVGGDLPRVSEARCTSCHRIMG